MSQDPYSPTYVPDMVPNRADVGNVGSGREFGADLHQLYVAGRTVFPEAAKVLDLLTRAVHGIQPELAMSTSDAGNPAAMRRLLELRNDLQYALQQTSITMADVGEALVHMADDYAATDEAANAEFRRLIAASPLEDPGYRHRTDPPGPHDPQPSEPRPARAGTPH